MSALFRHDLIQIVCTFLGSCFTRVSLRARVATSRSVLGGPDRGQPSAGPPPIATEVRPGPARYQRPLAWIGAPPAHRHWHSQADLWLHLLVAQPSALELPGHQWRKPLQHSGRSRPRGHDEHGACVATPGGRAAPFRRPLHPSRRRGCRVRNSSSAASAGPVTRFAETSRGARPPRRERPRVS